MDHLASLDSRWRLPYVLTMPWTCPGKCGEAFALLVDKPFVMEVERGLYGRSHLECLAGAMKLMCDGKNLPFHLRTDGHTVWNPMSQVPSPSAA